MNTPTEAHVFEAGDQWFATFDTVVVPVTVWLDALDVPCEPEKAASCIAGTEAFGYVRIELMGEVDPESLH